MIWRYRLITLVPVVMSLVGCVSCFIVGTNTEIAAIGKVLSSEIKRGNANLAISKVMGRINFYYIRTTLLIFRHASMNWSSWTSMIGFKANQNTDRIC